MGIRDELHDLRLLGIKNYLWLGFVQRWVWRFDDWRSAQQKARAERKEHRLMKTSTFDALTETMGLEDLDEDERDPSAWSQTDYEGVLADTIAVERRRWIERAQWIVLSLITAGLGMLAGWFMQPQYTPQPWDCTVMVNGTDKEVSVVRCEGVSE